jgi:Cys-tRNA(Pro)/Cys-tRNA(Cys) deacylase
MLSLWVLFGSYVQADRGIASYNIYVISSTNENCMKIGETSSTPVTCYLDERGIPYRFFRHPGTIYSLEQAAQERGQRPEQIVRSILFRLTRGGFVMVLVAGQKQVAWPALRKHLGQSRISMATEAEVLQVTGYPLGAVSPFGTHQPVRVLLDKGILAVQEISIGSGMRFSTIIMRREDFLHALGEVEMGDFASENEITG